MVCVEHGLCDRCGTCIALCPADALSLSTRALNVSAACVDCGRCVAICPVGALALVKSGAA